MECNKRNRNIRYAIFRDSNSYRILKVLLNLDEIIFSYFCDRFSKLERFFPFLDPLFFTFLADLSKRKVTHF